MDIYKLSTAGVNVTEGINRFNGNTAMYEKYIDKFSRDLNYKNLGEAIEEKSVEAAFTAAHTLKGVAGNLSMTRLYEDLMPLVEELRGGSLTHAEELFEPVKNDYQQILTALGREISDDKENKEEKDDKEEKQKKLLDHLEMTSRELRRKYEVEKRRSRDDKSILAYAVFNLQTGETLEMDRRHPLTSLDSTMSLEDFRDDIASCIISDEKKKRFQEIFDVSTLMRMYGQGVDEQNLEFQRVLPGGKVIWVKTSFHLMIEPEGTNMLLFYYCNDINLRKSLEIMTVHITNEDYDMLGCINFHDDSAIMMYGKNSSYGIRKSKEFYQEESYSQSLDWFIKNAVVPEEREKYQDCCSMAEIKSQLAQNGVYEFYVHVDGEDNKRLTKKIRYTRYDRESEICLFTQNDITALIAEEERKQAILKNALLEAKNANEAKTSFLSRMSHDMRTPMNGILGLAALSENEDDPKVLRENIRKIQESGDYLLSLINDILDFQRIKSGKMKLKKQIVASQNVLDGILDIVRPGIEKKKINFSIENRNADLNWYIVLDPVRFKQIFINLLSNAVKFTPEGGNVSFVFGCTGREGMVSHDYIKVSDNGIGMSKEFIENDLFKPFSQGDNSLSSEYAGSGLGLSIVHSLVELMGGRIEVQSELGVGTTFTVYLDFQRIEQEEAMKRLSNGKKRLTNVEMLLRGKRMLVVEDQALNAEIARRLLERAGCIVDTARNGKEALEIVQGSEGGFYDAVLMDIRMPVMDGIAATKAIRTLGNDSSKNVPIIAMTANAYDEDVANALDAGMNAHLAKPIEPDRLYETLADFVNQ